ncbi:hypothetical protein NEOLEDRAFT_1132166 [Neolentinus lepideus HHB14362 ss-1]|uniref:Inositol-pentakisphosphate 2-kinase n=1 Tax=Neolentinus lepideus HHB14362 ss-1 TaxID=1314782 RepID=A0A165TGC8_9AGAM|nr:hypothetical protein NEOLEDRAFT_1132166 [Neolentinus lepideus HHB14362 ss-1]
MFPTGFIHTVLDTNPKDWSYLSEGGATMVLSYRGPPDPRFDGMVLRLKKTAVLPLNSQLDNALTTGLLTRVHDDTGDKREGNYEDPGISSIQCQNKIIRQLIPERYLPRLSLIRTDPVWLSQLADLIQPSRPVLRCQHDVIDTLSNQAILATDLTAGEGWSVEIKPKWGFLPNPTHLSSDTKSVKTRTCRYCMHSYLKSLKGQTAADTFCPLDLYSGRKERVATALGALWDEWISKAGHINSLKVFLGGRILQANDPTSMMDLRHAMLESSPGCLCSEKMELRELFVARLTSVIISSRVLAMISKLQRSFDPLDIEGLSCLWAKHRGTVGDAREVLPAGPEPTLDEYVAFVERYLTSGAATDHDHPDVQDLWYYTVMHLLSGIFKDCSIIVRPGLDRRELGCSAEPVTIIDLDRKPIRKLRHWAELDREIVGAYRSSGLDKRCMDEGRDS